MYAIVRVTGGVRASIVYNKCVCGQCFMKAWVGVGG